MTSRSFSLPLGSMIVSLTRASSDLAWPRFSCSFMTSSPLWAVTGAWSTTASSAAALAPRAARAAIRCSPRSVMRFSSESVGREHEQAVVLVPGAVVGHLRAGEDVDARAQLEALDQAVRDLAAHDVVVVVEVDSAAHAHRGVLGEDEVDQRGRGVDEHSIEAGVERRARPGIEVVDSLPRVLEAELDAIEGLRNPGVHHVVEPAHVLIVVVVDRARGAVVGGFRVERELAHRGRE